MSTRSSPSASPAAPSPTATVPSPAPASNRSSQNLERKSTPSEGKEVYNASASVMRWNPLRDSQNKPTTAPTQWEEPELDGCLRGLESHREKLNRVKESAYPVCCVLIALAIGSEDNDLITVVGSITGLATVLMVAYGEFLLMCKDQEEFLPEQEDFADFETKLQDAGLSRATIAALKRDVVRAGSPEMQERILKMIKETKPNSRTLLQQLSNSFTSVLLPSICGALIPLTPWLISLAHTTSWEIYFSASVSLVVVILITVTTPPPGTWTEIITSQIAVFCACIGLACALGAICIPLRKSSESGPTLTLIAPSL
eukprot:TRINITY_DN6059_c0_g1_i2.p1 TRINITY_DN6059_c0_g1~~TRINITY_DN6059_c0_g1_i2.p1  ORF type:complete len:314 (+),score=49.68 TRINITY_DN6059_c0_g1_i2:35-976(+)